MLRWEPHERHVHVALELLANKEYLSLSLRVGKSSAAVASNRIT
jgi:hypothetical protein